MKVTFITSAARPDQFPRHALPEVAFAGRSNVGKSSLINRLTGHAGAARVSKRPGCTRTLNFFAVDATACLVDLPGYGYARVSKKERGGWREAIEAYLSGRDNLRGVVVVADASVPPSDLDVEMVRYARGLGVRVLAVATKLDKVPARRRPSAVGALAAALGGGAGEVLPFSAVTGDGRDRLLAWVAAACDAGRIA